MSGNNPLRELVSVDNEYITVNHEIFSEIFESEEVASIPVSINAVIGRDIEKCSQLFGQLVEQCLMDSPSLNPSLGISTSFSTMFLDACKNWKTKTGMVIFSSPIFSKIDGQDEKKIANFFIGVWSKDSGNEEFIVLSGLAAALASSILYYVDSNIQV